MAFSFETSGNNTFLVYAIQEEDTLDTMTLGMITNNRIPGMASVLYTQMNRDCFLKYNVTARVTVKQFFSGVVNRRRLLGVFSSVAAALAAAEEYMIDCNTLLLDTEYMYADVSTCKAEVICLPVIRETEKTDSGMFFKNIMFTTQFDQTENCDYVARIINYLNSMPVFVAEDFLRLLEELQGMGTPHTSAPAQPRPAVTMSQPDSQPQQSGPALQTNNMEQPQAKAMAQPQQSAPAPRGQAPAQPQQSAPAPRNQASAQPRQSAPEPGKQGSSRAAGMGFAVPGQSSDGGFAVPGQSGDNGFAVPGQSRPGGTAGADQQAAGKRQKKAQKDISKQSASGQPASEKEMSMFYLLQHYNKENAAAYKAQKEAKKKSGKGVSGENAASASGFAVPGQQAQIQQSGGGCPPVQPQIQQPGGSCSPVQPQIQQPGGQLPPVQPQPAAWQPPVQSLSSGDNFGDTVVMGADGCGEDTVVIGAAMGAAIQPYLRRSSNNEKILLDKPVFHIGKERSYVDYCITGNATISRSHADIIGRDGQYFIVDNNSTNHTYVNGEMIPSNTEIPLSHGTKIRLSNEDFEFLIF